MIIDNRPNLDFKNVLIKPRTKITSRSQLI